MALDAKGAAALALHRFGLGPRAGSIAAIASDPRGALLAELDKPAAGQITDNSMLTAPQAARLAFSYNQEQQAKRIASRITWAAASIDIDMINLHQVATVST